MRKPESTGGSRVDVPDHVNIIAHRGASGLCGQDNTLASFELAIHLGCDMVELDVRCTSDGQLACFHAPAVEGARVLAHSKDLTTGSIYEKILG